jgi:hypothetical protein
VGTGLCDVLFRYAVICNCAFVGCNKTIKDARYMH